MNAKDLMIDDIVRVAKDVCIPKGTVVSIKGIDADNCFREKHLVGCATCLPINDEYRMTYGVWVEYLEPIPLTPEILEKNGYHTTPVYDMDDDSIVYPHIDLLGEWTWYNGKIYYSITDEEMVVLFDCKYVHEFQNFLRCVGIKKEIVL